LIIRAETIDDHQAIYDLTEAAFAPMSFSDGTEAAIIGKLRDADDLILSLVADDQGVIGHAAFSPVTVDAVGRWAGLGPIAVDFLRQKQGIGTQLVDQGIRQLEDLDFDGVVLIGNPKVYGPMGFVSDGRLHYRDLPAEIVQWYSITGHKPSGRIIFAPALEE